MVTIELVVVWQIFMLVFHYKILLYTEIVNLKGKVISNFVWIVYIKDIIKSIKIISKAMYA